MKKLLACSYFSLFTLLLYSQNVGINTPTPEARLHINGDVRITDGTQGIGEVLTSDANGLASWQPVKTAFTLASSASVAANDYIGLGSSSSQFVKNSIVIPFNCEITSLTFSTRSIAGSTYTCTIWVRPGNSTTPAATSIQATVTPGNYFSVATGSIALNQGDLLSVRMSVGTPDGIAASIGYK